MSKRKAVVETAKSVKPAAVAAQTDSDAEEDAALANLTIDDADDLSDDALEAAGLGDEDELEDSSEEEDIEDDEDEDGDEEDEEEEEEDDDEESDDEGLEGSDEFETGEEGDEDEAEDEKSDDEHVFVPKKKIDSGAGPVAKPARRAAKTANPENDNEEGSDDDSGYSSKERRNTRPGSTSTTELPWWRTNPEIDPVYDSDTSDEEQTNTIGNVPLEWYADYPHIGYTVDGKKVMKPATADALDEFLDKMDDPDSWRTFSNPYEGKNVVLSKEELDIIKRLQGQEFGDSSIDPFEPTIEWYTSKTMEMPLTGKPEPKRRFIPSKWEGKRIMKIVQAIRKGWIVPGAPKVPPKPQVYLLWNDSDEPAADHPMHIPAPKVAPPEHAESYNPPAEYVPTDKEKSEWEQMDPEDRPRNFVPKKHKNLRSVAAYSRLINERFERCLDLYLCPRVRRNKIQMDPEALLPKLPDPKDLQPFPMNLSITYEHGGGRVRALSCDPTGRWMVSGGDSGQIKLWEVATGRNWRTWEFEGTVHSLAFNPNKALSMFAAAVGNSVYLIATGLENEGVTADTEAVFKVDAQADDKIGVVWSKGTAEEQKQGVRAVLKFARKVTNVVWHRKGDYFAALTPDAPNSPISVHQLSKKQSQSPFRKSKGTVQKMLFHPSKPFLFVATQRYVRVYDLMKQELHKTLQSGVKWISSLDVHPGGDNVIIGSFDKRICWFDMDLSSKPYRVLRSHAAAVRGVSFHKRYPLFASCSDDGTVQIFHGTVYNDLMQNPLIVPVKVLRGHEIADGLGVLGVEFHPVQPWVLSCGADGTIRLFS